MRLSHQSHLTRGLNRGARLSVLSYSVNDGESTDRPFQRWRKNYKIPIQATLQALIFCMYILMALYFQKNTVGYSLEFSKACNNYFMSEYGFDDPPEDSNAWYGDIESVSGFLEILESSATRLFSFNKVFPCRYKLSADKNMTLNLQTMNGLSTTVLYNSTQVYELVDFVRPFTRQFTALTITLKHYLDVPNNDNFIVDISIEFKIDEFTHSVKMHVRHTRLGEAKFTASNLNVLIPCIIAALSFIAIIHQLSEIRSIYIYLSSKARRNRMNVRSYFWKRFDKWLIATIFFNLFSIVSCVVYIINNENFRAEVPISLVLMGLSSCGHCILIIQYFRIKPSSLIIINMMFKSSLKLLFFACGCLIIFAAYLVAGCCLFGTFSEDFSSVMKGAIILVAVLHGDSIVDGYSTVQDNSDNTFNYGFIYTTVWVLFGLLIMFNITIAIVQAVLKTEVFDARRKAEQSEDIALPLIVDRVE